MKLFLARTALLLSLLVPVYFAAAALGVKFGVIDWQTGLLTLTFQYGIFLLGGALVIALIAFIAAIATRPRRGWAIALIALLIPAAGLGFAMSVGQKAEALPPIHDVATNTDDPPVFSEAVMKLRAETPAVNPVNPLTAPLSESSLYKSNSAFEAVLSKSPAELAKAAYPDVTTLKTTAKPAAAFPAVVAAAEAMGLATVTSDSAGGVYEGYFQSFWFGFKDDVAVRIRPDGEGSAIDVRSTSRVGISDLGANAARIKALLADVSKRLAS
jgi:fatty-acyl-CoA synthase